MKLKKFLYMLLLVSLPGLTSARLDIPIPNFKPDEEIVFPGEKIKEIIENNFPDKLRLNNINIDISKVKQKRVNLWGVNCPSVPWHTVDISFLSHKDNNKRSTVDFNGDKILLDSLSFWVVPKLRVENKKLYLDVSAEISWVQNIEWSYVVVKAINDMVQNEINPELPSPIYSVEIPAHNTDISNIREVGILLDGCAWDSNRKVIFKLKR